MLHGYIRRWSNANNRTREFVYFCDKIFCSCDAQASNIIIQTTPSNGHLQNPAEEGQTVEDQQQQHDTVDASAEMSTVRFEIHTDEHGQIINIQPAVLQGIPSRNGRSRCYVY